MGRRRGTEKRRNRKKERLRKRETLRVKRKNKRVEQGEESVSSNIKSGVVE